MLTEEKIQELKAKYGELHEITAEISEDESLVVTCRAPSRPLFARFTKEAKEDMHRAMTNLVNDCLLDPDLATVKAKFEQYPGLPATLAGDLLELAKAGVKTTVRTF